MPKEIHSDAYWNRYREIYPQDHSKEIRERRIGCALNILNSPGLLQNWIGLEFLDSGHVPNFISIDKTSIYGQGGQWMWKQQVGQYFKNLDEFVDSALKTKKIDVRDYNPEKDHFDIDINGYELIKVYEKYPLALACKTCITDLTPCGERPLRIDVYPSRDFKIQLYTEYIEVEQQKIFQELEQIKKLQEHILNASKKIEALNQK